MTKTYGQNVGLKFDKEENLVNGIITTLKPKATMEATVVSYGDEAKKDFPDLKEGDRVIMPFQSMSVVDGICYVNAHQIIGFLN